MPAKICFKLFSYDSDVIINLSTLKLKNQNPESSLKTYVPIFWPKKTQRFTKFWLDIVNLLLDKYLLKNSHILIRPYFPVVIGVSKLKHSKGLVWLFALVLVDMYIGAWFTAVPAESLKIRGAGCTPFDFGMRKST